eukprot:3271417-Pyramimonas_sp.AAC.1
MTKTLWLSSGAGSPRGHAKQERPQHAGGAGGAGGRAPPHRHPLPNALAAGGARVATQSTKTHSQQGNATQDRATRTHVKTLETDLQRSENRAGARVFHRFDVCRNSQAVMPARLPTLCLVRNATIAAVCSAADTHLLSALKA